jgi:methanethiol S-methyltransferase
MLRWLALLFWAFSVLVTLPVLLYFVGFVLNRYSFNSIDSGLQIPTREAALMNLGVLALFGLQHSSMARRWFKRWVPAPIERAVYLLATSAVLIVLFFRWEPMPASVWFLRTQWPFQILLAAAGIIVVWAAASQGALHFFGFHQVWAYFRGRVYSPPAFKTPGLYRYTRHPMMIGTLIFLWATPDMTQGHLLFSAVMTLYIALAVGWEERDLERAHGEAYRRYRQGVRQWV